MSPSATMACERRPWMSVTMATPQESDSFRWVVQPLGVGQCRKQHLEVPPQSGKIFVRDCTGPVIECISAAARYPARRVGTSGNPGRLRTTVQVMAATAMTTIAGAVINGCPRRQRTQEPGGQHGQADEEKYVVDDGSAEVAVQHVVGHPKAAAGRAVPTGQRLERADGKHEVRVVRIAEADVGQGADENGAGAQRPVAPSSAGSGARCHRAMAALQGRGPCR